jgi:glycosyltransferase involved in cell wall biosynthesis
MKKQFKKFQTNTTIKNIVYYSLGYENDAISYLRCLGPAEKLNINVLLGVEEGVINIELVNNAEIIFIERDFPKKLDEYYEIRNLARFQNKPIIFDIDDLLFELPENHPDRISSFYSTSLLPILDAIIDSDLVIVSSENLKNYFLHYNKNIEIFHNYLIDDIWKLDQNLFISNEQPIIIGYMGGHTHLTDLDSIKSVILNILEKYGEKVILKIWGFTPPEELKNHRQVEWTIPNLWKYPNFAEYFQKLKVDIFIAPLIDNDFNKSKSFIKYLEYGSLGVPGIFSNVEPYKNIIVNKINGFLASSLQDWEKYLSFLIENEQERKKISKNIIINIEENWLLSKNITKWNELLKLSFETKDKNLKVDNAYLRQFLNINNQISTKIKLIENENFNKDQLINEKERLVNELQSELMNLKLSRSWKVAQYLQNGFNKIVPINSKRHILLRRIFHRFKYWRNYFRIINNKKHKRNYPLISVVIPIFDRTDILIESIESILKQSYKNFELILVCDGSPEDTLKIVKNYESNYKKVRVFYFKNNSGNAVRGRNKGIKEAHGKFLAFQDSDDIAEPDRLKISLFFINSFDADVVYGGWRAINDGSRDIEIKNGEEIYSPECSFDLLKTTCVPCQSTVMANVSVLREVGGFNENMKYREDHELWLRIAYLGYKFKAIDKILTNLRLHNNNLELKYKDSDDKWFSIMHEEFKNDRTMKPKIGYIIPGTGISGGIAVICEHTNRLLKRGYDVTMISEDNKNEINWYPNQLVEIIPITDISDNYDILVATGWTTAYYLTTINAKRKIYFVQSDESRFFEKNDPNVVRVLETYQFDYEFMTEAKWIKHWLKEKFKKDAIYVPNGLNQDIFFQTNPLEPKTKKLRVLLEGPISVPFKGMADAFEVVGELDCEVWCVSSSGVPKQEWKCDRFFNKIPMDYMKKIYSSCDILLKMSKVEGFFGPPLEMMACGGTVVVGKVTGYDEYIIDGYNGLVVEEGDILSAQNAIINFQENRELLNKLKINGKKTSIEWNWERSIDILEKFFYG